jgi:hypothetical protein
LYRLSLHARKTMYLKAIFSNLRVKLGQESGFRILDLVHEHDKAFHFKINF